MRVSGFKKWPARFSRVDLRPTKLLVARKKKTWGTQDNEALSPTYNICNLTILNLVTRVYRPVQVPGSVAPVEQVDEDPGPDIAAW